MNLDRVRAVKGKSKKKNHSRKKTQLWHNVHDDNQTIKTYQVDLIKELGHVFAAAEKNTEQFQTLISGPLLMLSRLQTIRMNHAQAAFQTIFNHHGVEQIISLLCWIQSQIAES